MSDDSVSVKGQSLDEFLGHVALVIKREIPGTYWVRAEILNFSKRNYWSVELASYGNEAQKAKVRAVIWGANSNIVSKFESTTGMQLKAGLKILFSCSIQFHPEFGVSLNITDIDPSFTLGDMELRLNQIRQRLQSLGEIDRNRRLIIPREFLSVAVISPADAAGLGDFKSQVDPLQKYGLCKFEYFQAQFQGANVAESVIGALVAANDRLKQGAKYDVLVIIRGGGDKAGLLQLNEIKIARGICRFPIPVLVGIGHERDTTILDEVANQSFPTPSLVGSYIKSCVVKNAREAQVHYEKFAGASQRLFYLAIQDAGHYRSLLEFQAQKQLERSKVTVIRIKQTIVYAADTAIQKSKYSNSTLYENLRNSATQQTRTAGEYVRSLKRDILNNAHSNSQRASSYTRNHFERLIYSSKSKLNSDRSNITRLNTQLISDARYKASQLSSSIRYEYQQLTAFADQIVSSATYTLNFQRSNLINAGQLNISKSKGEVTLLIQRVLLQDPQKILSLGFAYLKGHGDSVITKVADVKVGQEVSIYMKDGKTKALILGE